MMGLALQTGWSPETMAAMPQSELFAWFDALMYIRGDKTVHVSDTPPAEDPRNIELPDAVRTALTAGG